jgi:hypothetical protein
MPEQLRGRIRRHSLQISFPIQGLFILSGRPLRIVVSHPRTLIGGP